MKQGKERKKEVEERTINSSPTEIKTKRARKTNEDCGNVPKYFTERKKEY